MRRICAPADARASTPAQRHISDPMAHDKILVGDFYGNRPVDPDNFPQRPSDESLEEVIERACLRVPNWKTPRSCAALPASMT